MTIKNYVEVAGQKYSYTIDSIDENISRIICKPAQIDQEFLNEDIVALLGDIPHLIQAEKKYQAKQDSVIRFRVSGLEKARLQKQVKQQGYTTLSAFIKDKIL